MTSHPERRQKKITIGEVRAAGVRGVLIYCTTAAATGPALTPIGGLMTSGSRTSSAVWLAQLAAGAALTFGRTGSGYQLSQWRLRQSFGPVALSSQYRVCSSVQPGTA
jgi:hypothetical protein